MNTSENGNQQHDAVRDLPAIPWQPASPELQQSRPAQSGTAIADTALATEQPDLAEAARERRRQHRVRRLLISAEFRAKDRVLHPDGGRRPVEEVQQDEAAQRALIEEETRMGSRKHHRLPRWLRRVPQLVLVFDFLLLLYFFAGITDVNWGSPLSAPLLFALLLAAIVTLLSYGFLTFTGHRMRMHKDHSGTVPLAELDTWTKAALGGALAVIAVLAALMFTRMRTEVLYALGALAGGTALVIALTLAVVSAAANFLVVAIHALDGSDQVDRLDKLSAALRRPLAKAHRMLEQAAHNADQ